MFSLYINFSNFIFPFALYYLHIGKLISCNFALCICAHYCATTVDCTAACLGWETLAKIAFVFSRVIIPLNIISLNK